MIFVFQPSRFELVAENHSQRAAGYEIRIGYHSTRPKFSTVFGKNVRRAEAVRIHFINPFHCIRMCVCVFENLKCFLFGLKLKPSIQFRGKFLKLFHNSRNSQNFHAIFEISCCVWFLHYVPTCLANFTQLSTFCCINRTQLFWAQSTWFFIVHSKPELLRGVYAMGFNKPSRIQVNITQHSAVRQISQDLTKLTNSMKLLYRKRHYQHCLLTRHKIWLPKVNPVQVKRQRSSSQCWAVWIHQRTIHKFCAYRRLTSWPSKPAKWQQKLHNFRQSNCDMPFVVKRVSTFDETKGVSIGLNWCVILW